jgi:hypothetical protein
MSDVKKSILLIKEKEAELAVEYPIEANYGSRCSLWTCGINGGLVSRELYDLAREYYGRLWTYAGD